MNTSSDLHPINEEALFQFCGGTSRYWRHFISGIAYTDGIRYLMENGAAWLIDAIASYLPSIRQRTTERARLLENRGEALGADLVRDMTTRHLWHLAMQSHGSATLEARPYRGEALIRQAFLYAEFPLEEIEILCGCWDGSAGIRWIISLPIED